MTEHTGKRIVLSSLGVTGATITASAASFLTQVVIAKYFGVSSALDAYLAAGALPLTITAVMTAGIGFILIPLLSEVEARSGDITATLDNTFLLAVFGALLVVTIGFFLSNHIIRWYAPRFSVSELALAAHIQKYFWAATGATTLASFAICLHNYRLRFALPAVLTILPPLGMILATVLLASRMGIDSLAAGYLAGAGLQCTILFVFIPERLRFKFSAFSATTKKFLRGLPPLALSLLPFTFLPVVDAFWSSRLPSGSLSYLGYSSRIVIGLTSVTIQGLTVVIFPFLSQNFAEGNFAVFRSRLLSTLKVIFVFMATLASIVWALRIPALTIVFQHGRFGAAQTVRLSEVLGWYLVGMVGMACMNLINRGFYSALRFKAPALLGLVFLVFYFSLSGILSAHFSFVGIGMTYAVYWVLISTISLAWLGHNIGGLVKFHDVLFFIKVAIIALFAAEVSHYAWLHIQGQVGVLSQIALSGLIGICLIAGLAWFLFSTKDKGLFINIWARAFK